MVRLRNEGLGARKESDKKVVYPVSPQQMRK